MILGLNAYTFWGIITLILGNLIGYYLIHTGGRKTTESLLLASTEQTSKKIDESGDKIIHPVHNLDKFHLDKFKPEMEKYRSELEYYKGMREDFNEINSGRVKIEGTKGKEKLIKNNMYKGMMERNNKVVEMRKNIENMFASYQTLVSRIPEKELSELFEGFLKKFEAHKQEYLKTIGNYDDMSKTTELLDIANESLLEIETKNNSYKASLNSSSNH